MDIRRRRHHCHPHRCAAITIAVAAPPSPSLRRHRHRCAAIAIAAPPPTLPSLRSITAPHRCAAIAALPPQLLRSHRLCRRCATTTSTPVSRAPVNDASASRAFVDDTNATIKCDEWVVVERERGEDNDGDHDFDNDDIGEVEAMAKTTMTTTSDAHVGGGTIDTTIKN